MLGRTATPASKPSKSSVHWELVQPRLAVAYRRQLACASSVRPRVCTLPTNFTRVAFGFLPCAGGQEKSHGRDGQRRRTRYPPSVFCAHRLRFKPAERCCATAMPQPRCRYSAALARAHGHAQACLCGSLLAKREVCIPGREACISGTPFSDSPEVDWVGPVLQAVPAIEFFGHHTCKSNCKGSNSDLAASCDDKLLC